MNLVRIQAELADMLQAELVNCFGKEIELEGFNLGEAKNPEHGEFALPMFFLAKQLQKNPKQIAEEFAEHMIQARIPKIQLFEAVNGYLNIKLDARDLAVGVLQHFRGGSKIFGILPEGEGKTVIVEFFSPNSNKPAHLGHVRNIMLGEALCRLLDFLGYTVVRTNLVNDKGVHICKSMHGYEMLGDGITPEEAGKKADHFVGRFYVAFQKLLDLQAELLIPSDLSADDLKQCEALLPLNKTVNEMLVQWENGDEEVHALWKKMNAWWQEGIEETLAELGIVFDRIDLESETYLLGSEVVDQGLKSGIFVQRDDESVVVKLPEIQEEYEKVVRKSDGTSLYVTQDIGTALKRHEETGFDRSIYVVGDEQILHFRVLFRIMEMLGYEWADGLFHRSYGMVELPEGKMKSREGKIVEADDLIAEVRFLVAERLRQTDTTEYTEDEIENISRAVGDGALRFLMLDTRAGSTIKFDPDASVELQGRTGPYIQYMCARINSVLAQGGYSKDDIIVPDYLHKNEEALVLQLCSFSRAVKAASAELDPSFIADFAYETAQVFSRFYANCSILNAESEALIVFRKALCVATRTILIKALDLLGITAPEKM